MEKILITEIQFDELMSYITKLQKYENFNKSDEVIIKCRKANNGLIYLVSIEGLRCAWGWCATEMINEYTDTIKKPLNELLKNLHPYTNTIRG